MCGHARPFGLKAVSGGHSCQWWRALLLGWGRGDLQSELAMADGVGGFGENHLSPLGSYVLTFGGNQDLSLGLVSLENKAHVKTSAQCLAQAKSLCPHWWLLSLERVLGSRGPSDLDKTSGDPPAQPGCWLWNISNSFPRLMGQQGHRGQCHSYTAISRADRVGAHPQSLVSRSRVRVARAMLAP